MSSRSPLTCRLITLRAGFLVSVSMVAQDAAPADRNAVNTRARPGDMMADSPVTFKKALKALAAEERCAYLDLTTPWAEYIRSSKLHPHVFYRDVVHANEYGEQILAKILMASIGSTRPLPEHRAP